MRAGICGLVKCDTLDDVDVGYATEVVAATRTLRAHARIFAFIICMKA
jgi:hypothetical protein